MSKELYLAGSDHGHHDYNWLFEQINSIKPDCITLEQSIDGALGIYWDFKNPLDKMLKEHKVGQHLCGEFAAGIHHARQNNLPVFCIDDYEPYETALVTDMNKDNNFEILRKNNNPRDKKYWAQETESNWTNRNNLMATAIYYHFQISGFEKIIHIGGRGHYDEKRCTPLQKLVTADSIEIIDAVNKTRIKYK